MKIVVAVGEALLSASVQPLIKTLSELNIFVQREKIDADINDWKMILAEINALLDNAEDTQMTNPAVKIWLDEFRDLIYDIEDVLDEFNTEAMKRDMMEDPQASTSKLRKFLSTCFTSSAFKNNMVPRIKHITERLKHIKVRQEQTLNLRRIANGTRSKQLKERLPTTSLVDDSHIYGRNDEKEAIVQKLLRDEGSNNPISVIPILGMGGIGKTTLAQLVYNDSAVKDHFDIKVWVCVSENFDVVGLTRTILRNVYLQIRYLKDPEMHDLKDPEMHDLKDLDLNSLQEKLKGKLSQKKFLLILDDVWEEDYNLWDLLHRPFVSAATSSKIVVTTRKSNVAPIRSDVHAYHVKELPNDECLCLLARHALAVHNFDARLDLKDIGLKLVKRCNGLPLAAKVLGGLLRNKPSHEQWERVLKNKWWNSPKTSNNVHPTLKLSYDDLPSHLKRCFTYCAIFPKDYEFGRDELVRLWMGEGFLQHPQGGMVMEDLGIEYFEDLVSRSFFQWSSSNQSTNSMSSAKFVMHDLISDLAQTIAGDICYNYENKTEVDMSSSKYEKVRHASFYFGEDSQEYEIYSQMKRLRTIWRIPFSFHQDSQEYEVYSQMKRLRTIWRRCDSYPDREFYGNKMLEELSTHLKCVRVLYLSDSRTAKLSKSIGDLIHLRHMNLSCTYIQWLPETVSNLFNLQTLLLHSCFELEKLPDKIRNLVNLRHLDISVTRRLKKLPSGIGMLTNLQTLSKFIVQEGDGATIVELQNLNNLRGSLSIQGLQYVRDAESANLKGKQGLEELELKWSGGHGRSDVSVLESLEPHQNLKRLTISYYGGAEFPSWMSNTHLFSKLVSLNLRDCKETKVLPPLGQLCLLKELFIDSLEAVKSIGVELYGNAAVPFPSLERLEIIRMSEWSEWSHGNMGGDQGFPNLQLLQLNFCPKLIGSLPSGLHRLRHLSELSIKGCRSLVSFPPMGLPCCLKRIEVRSCDALQCFPIIYTDDSEQSLLEELYIECCSSLKYFQRNFKLPNSLRNLEIRYSRNLLSLPDGLMVQDDNANQSQSHLEHLEITGCQRLTAVTTGKFPAALKFLQILECNLQLESPFSENNKALEKIVISKNNNIKALPSIDCLPSLKELSISDCPALESFPEMGFLSTSLQKLNWHNLPLLAIRMQSHFPSLRELMIYNCPNVVSLVEADGAPQNLTTLEITNCEKLRQPIAEWGLGMLSSLKLLTVKGRFPATSDVVLFPDDNCCWLPTSLKILYMNDFMNLESVSMGLQRLTSLEQLRIVLCPKLRSLPKEALPFSLKLMYIYGCPLLKKDDFSERKGLDVRHND